MIVTVTLTPSISGPRVTSWRKQHHQTNFALEHIPYKLVSYLCLIPKRDWTGFTNRLYDFSNDDLKKLKPDGISIKVTASGNSKKVTIDTVKFIESPNLLGEL